LGDVLKRTVWWPSGQVGTDNAVLDAYSLWESGWEVSMTGSGSHPPCSCFWGVARSKWPP
jgi:hypothetical protein